jgi:hypothetical protein
MKVFFTIPSFLNSYIKGRASVSVQSKNMRKKAAGNYPYFRNLNPVDEEEGEYVNN